MIQQVEIRNPSKHVERVAVLTTEDSMDHNPLASLSSGEGRTFVWRTYEPYRFKGYISAADGAAVKEEYEPLLDAPDLFFDFARVSASYSEAEGEEEQLISLYQIVRWIRHYGVLGLTPTDEAQQFPGSNLVVAGQPTDDFFPGDYGRKIQRRQEEEVLLPSYSDRGGPEETIEIFLRESAKANGVLSLYTAALFRDEHKLEEILDFSGRAQRLPGAAEMLEKYLLERKHDSRIDILVDMATRALVALVQGVLSRFAFPSLSFSLSDPWRTSEHKLQSPESLTATLWPRNLLGAMYLQFYWLMTSATKPSYCKYCGKAFSSAQIMPGGGKRKTYKNKKYCSKQCRQNYDYHNRRKHRRDDS